MTCNIEKNCNTSKVVLSFTILTQEASEAMKLFDSYKF